MLNLDAHFNLLNSWWEIKIKNELTTIFTVRETSFWTADPISSFTFSLSLWKFTLDTSKSFFLNFIDFFSVNRINSETFCLIDRIEFCSGSLANFDRNKSRDDMCKAISFPIVREQILVEEVISKLSVFSKAIWNFVWQQALMNLSVSYFSQPIEFSDWFHILL